MAGRLLAEECGARQRQGALIAAMEALQVGDVVRLPRGRYLVGVRGTDSFGHRELKRRVYNTIELRVR